MTRSGARSETVEASLLARALALDPVALATIHDQYYEPVFRYVRFRIPDQEAAEDVTAEAFARLLAALQSDKPPRTTLRGWLYGVASNLVADHHRRRHRHPEVGFDEAMPSRDDDPAASAERVARWGRIEAALGDLTADQQEVIALRFGYGSPIKEVARAMGKTEGAVKQLQARAVARLAQMVSPAAAD